MIDINKTIAALAAQCAKIDSVPDDEITPENEALFDAMWDAGAELLGNVDEFYKTVDREKQKILTAKGLDKL